LHAGRFDFGEHSQEFTHAHFSPILRSGQRTNRCVKSDIPGRCRDSRKTSSQVFRNEQSRRKLNAARPESGRLPYET
jgi:hypothetical protein